MEAPPRGLSALSLRLKEHNQSESLSSRALPLAAHPFLMATDAEQPPNDHEDELQLALALSLSEAEAAAARTPRRPVRSPRSPPSPALSEVVEVLTPPTRASAPPPSPSFTEARRPDAPR